MNKISTLYFSVTFIILMGFTNILNALDGSSCQTAAPMYPAIDCNNDCPNYTCGHLNCPEINCNPVSMAGNGNSSSLDGSCIGDDTGEDAYWLKVYCQKDNFEIHNNAGTNLDYTVFSGDCSSLTEIGCFTLAAGENVLIDGLIGDEVYYVMITPSDDMPGTTQVNACITSSNPYINPYDDCEVPLDISFEGVYTFTNANATENDQGEGGGGGICSSGSIQNNIWLQWCIPSDWVPGTTIYVHAYNIDCNDPGGLQFAVYDLSTGSCGNWNGSVVCQNSGTIMDFFESFPANPGDCFKMQIDGWAGVSCEFNIQVSADDQPDPPCTKPIGNPEEIGNIGCSGSKFTYTPTADMAGTTFTWSSSAGTSGSGNINDNPTIDSNTPQTVTYTIIPTGPAPEFCIGDPFFVIIELDPAPTGVEVTDSICWNGTVNIAPDSNIDGSTYIWTGSNGSSGSDIITDNPINNGQTAINVTYTVIPTGPAPYNCVGEAFNIVVTVLPEILVNPPNPPIGVCSGEQLNQFFTSNVPGTTFEWSGNGNSGTGNLNDTPVNTSSSNIIITYTITPTGPAPDLCPGTPLDVDVTVYPDIVVTNPPAPITICSGENFSFSPESNVPGTTFMWIGSNGSSGSGTVSDNPNNILPASQTITYTITPTGPAPDFCPGIPYDLDVEVLAGVTGFQQNVSICNGESVSITPTANISDVTFTWTGNNGTSGTGNIVDTPEINGDNITTITYTVTPTGPAPDFCPGANFNIWVTISPGAIGIPENYEVCSGDILNIEPASDKQGDAFYSWTSDMGTDGNGTIDDVVQNDTDAAIDITYTVTALYAGCTSPPYEIVVTVNPSPMGMEENTLVVCSGDVINITPQSDIDGSTFAWTGDNGTSGTGNITDIPVNDTDTPLIISYTVTPTGPAPLNCPGSDFNISITVDPIPAGVPDNSLEICSGGDVNITPQSNVNGTTFSWTGDNGTSGTDDIIDNPINDTDADLIVTYTVTPTGPSPSSCPGNPFNISVTVLAAPVGVPDNTSVICSGQNVNITPISNMANATYTWTGDNGTSGTGDIIDNPINDTNTDLIVTYTVIPTGPAPTNCEGSAFEIQVTVSAGPSGTPETLELCSGDALDYAPQADIAGTSFTWTGDNGTSGTGNITDTPVNSGTSIQTVIYTVTPASGTCTGADFDITLNVYPLPSGNPVTDEICSGDAISIDLSSDIAGTTFIWTSDNGTSGTGTITDNPVNTTSNPATVTYTVTPAGPDPLNCTGADFDIVVTVNPIPETPAVANEQICAGQDLPDLSASSSSGGLINWYDADPSGGNANSLGTGNILGAAKYSSIANNSTAGTYTVYVSVKANGCESPAIPLTIEVVEQEDPAFDLVTEICVDANTSNPIPNITGTSGGTFSINNGISIDPATGEIDLSSVSTEGIYEVTYTTSDADCSNTSTQEININIAVSSGTAATELVLCSDDDTDYDLYSLISDYTPNGIWSETSATPSLSFNAAGASFNPNGEVTNTYTFAYTVDGTAPCEPQTTEVTISVNSPPIATIDPVSTSVCNGATGAGPSLNLNDFVSGDTGYWEDTDGTGLGAGPDLDFTGITANQSYTFTYYTNTAQSPCTDSSYELNVFVEDCSCPSIALNPAPELCSDFGTLDLTTILGVNVTETGTWTIKEIPQPSISPAVIEADGIIFNASNADAGDYTVQFTLDNMPPAGCPEFSEQTITVHPPVNAGTDILINECNDPNGTGVLDLYNILNDNPDIGGVWSVDASSPKAPISGFFDKTNGIFTIAGHPAGTYIFKYELSATAPCKDASALVTVIIEDMPFAILVDPEPICNTSGGGSILDLNSIINDSSNNGYWEDTDNLQSTGANINLDIIDADGIAAGAYTFTYVVEGLSGICSPQFFEIDIIIEDCDCPSLAMDTPPQLCNAQNLDLNSITITTEAGKWSISNIPAGSNNPATLESDGNTFNVTGADTGDYELTFTLDETVPQGCNQFTTVTITVIDNANASWTAPTGLCTTSPAFDLNDYLNTGATTGGTWTIEGTNNNAFDPLLLGEGSFNVVYTAGTLPCTDTHNAMITITQTAIADWTAPTDLCTGSSTFDLNTLLSNNATTGGIWTINGTVNNNFDPIALGAGNHIVNYSAGDSPCDASLELSVSVAALLNPAWTPPMGICENGPAFDLNDYLDANATTGGTWTINGISNNNFDPQVFGAGQHDVVYTVGTDPCDNESKQIIEVLGELSANFNVQTPVCINEPASIEYTGNAGNNAVFTWNVNGGTPANPTGPGPHDISWTTSGDKTITLSVEENGCSSELGTKIIKIDEPLPAPLINCQTTTSSITFIWDDVPGASGYNVTINGNPVTANGNSYTENGLAEGTDLTIIVEAIGTGACGNSSSEETCTAKNCPDIIIDIQSIADICLDADATAFDLTANINEGNGTGTGTWNGTGITDANAGTFDPNIAGTGTHTISYSFVEEGCNYNVSTSIIIHPVPDADFIMDDVFCSNGTNTLNVTYNGSASNNAQYNWDFGTATIISGSNQGPYELDFAGAGTYGISLTVEENGCLSQEVSQDIEVGLPLEAPVISCGETTISSVEFLWNDITGATDYEITASINGGTANTTTTNGNTNYIENGLNVGDEVTITVIALGLDPCGNSEAATQICIAQSCPTDLDISIDLAVIEYCVDESAFVLQATPSGGTFSGMGVSNGEFNPAGADIGDNIVTYDYTDPLTNCDYSTNIIITVFEVPVASFIIDPNEICADGTSTLNISFDGTAGNNAQFDWNFGGGTETDLGNNNYEVIFANGSGTTNISLSITENNCVSNTFSLPVTLYKPLTTPIVNCINQTTSSVSFEWNDVNDANSYEITYSINNGTPVTETIDQLNKLVDNLSVNDEVTISVIALSNTPCANSEPDTQTCNAEDCPTINPIISGLASEYCLDDAIITLTLTPAGGTLSGPGVVLPDQFDPVTAGTGTHILTYNYIDPNTQCSYSISEQVIVHAVPTADFSIADTEICNDGSMTTTVSYTGTASASANYDWDFNGADIISGTGAGPYTLNWSGEGVKTVSLSVTENNCIAETFNEMIEVYNPLSIPEVQCNGTTINSVSFSWVAIAGVTDYEVTISGAATGTETTTATNYEVTGLNPNDQITISVIALGINICGDSEAGTATCTAIDCPATALTFTGLNTQYCESESIITLAATPTGGIFTINSNEVSSIDPATIGIGVHTIVYTYTNSDGCVYDTQTDVEIIGQPEAIFDISDNVVCMDDNISFTFSGHASAGTVYEWDFEDLGPQIGLDNYTGAWNAVGEKTISLTVTNGICSDTYSTTVSISDMEVTTIEDTELLYGESIELTSKALSALNGQITYEWTDNLGNIDGITEQSPLVSPTETTIYTVIATDEYGCEALDEVTVKVYRLNTVAVPNAFSPNGDGINETFIVGGFNIADVDMHIYNRWGQELFAQQSSYDEQQGWDGTFENKRVPVGIYVFYALVKFEDGKERLLKGNVTLVR